MKNIFKKIRGGSDTRDKSRKYNYNMRELTNMQRWTARVIRDAQPADFNVYPETKTIYLMSEPLDTVTQWILSVRGNDNAGNSNAEYILGRYSSEAQADRMMRLVIKHRILPEFNRPTLRELVEQQGVA